MTSTHMQPVNSQTHEQMQDLSSRKIAQPHEKTQPIEHIYKKLCTYKKSCSVITAYYINYYIRLYKTSNKTFEIWGKFKSNKNIYTSCLYIII